MSQYQTIRYSNGEITKGAFPTLEWFEKIKRYVDFEGLNIVDVGCGEGMYSILAKLNNADRVVCIDSEIKAIEKCKELYSGYGYQFEVYTAKFEDMAFDMDYDVVFCNMILHWLEKGDFEFRRIADATKKYIITIYRSQNPYYELKSWFPYEEEIERLAESLGFEIRYKELLMTQDNNKKIFLTIFERYKQIIPKIAIVSKWNRHFNHEWYEKMLKLEPFFKNNPLVQIFPESYTTFYIEGRDLWGDRPFHPLHGKQRQVFLNIREKESIKKIIDSILLAGEKTGFYIQDVTKRNIILKDEKAFLIDYDNIGNKPNILFKI